MPTPEEQGRVKRIKAWAVYSPRYDDKIVSAFTDKEDAVRDTKRITLRWKVIPCTITYTL